MSLINNMLRQMNWCGYNPRNRTIIKIALGFLVWLIIFINFALSGFFLLSNTYNDIGFLMIDIVILTGYGQQVLKIWTLIANHRSILKLINLTEYKFWSLDMVPQSEHVDIQSIYNIVKLATKCYLAVICSSLTGHYITSYFRGKENLICNIWLPESGKEWNRTPVGHHIIFTAEAIVTFLAAFNGLNVKDGIYVTFIALVIGQLKIIKCKLMSLNESRSDQENMKEIADCVEHHKILFDYLQSIEDIFSTELLQVAGTNIILAVLSMYCCMMGHEIGQIIVYSLILVTANCQLFIYCFLGQLIQDETFSVADTVYMSKWQDIPNKNLRLGLLIIILRSQKCVNFSMGGLFNLSLELFTRVSRMMLSLLTFMMNSDLNQ